MCTYIHTKCILSHGCIFNLGSGCPGCWWTFDRPVRLCRWKEAITLGHPVRLFENGAPPDHYLSFSPGKMAVLGVYLHFSDLPTYILRTSRGRPFLQPIRVLHLVRVGHRVNIWINGCKAIRKHQNLRLNGPKSWSHFMSLFILLFLSMSMNISCNLHWVRPSFLAPVLQCQLLLPVGFDCSKWLAPSSWLVPCCWAAVHSWPPSCLPLAAPMCLLLQQALEPQQLWPRPPWWHHRQHLLMRAPCGSLLCPPLALASPLAWLQLVRVLARALLPADALMASLASLRWQMTCEVCCCCPWHSWSPWRFMAWWLPWFSSSPTHSSSERQNSKGGRARNLFSWQSPNS